MKKKKIRLPLVVYDAVILIAMEVLLLLIYESNNALSWKGSLFHGSIMFVCVICARYLGGVYRQIWRYGGIQCYIRLLFVDAAAFLSTWPLSGSCPCSMWWRISPLPGCWLWPA